MDSIERVSALAFRKSALMFGADSSAEAFLTSFGVAIQGFSTGQSRNRHRLNASNV
jgi:hypothetical protein